MKIFACQSCGKECGGNDNADQEAELYWGVKNASEKLGSGMVVVCDDCWEKMHPLDHLDEYKEALSQSKDKAAGK